MKDLHVSLGEQVNFSKTVSESDVYMFAGIGGSLVSVAASNTLSVGASGAIFGIFGALGVFGPYYSFTQDLTVKHQGKVTGLLGFLNWMAMAPLRVFEGRMADYFDNYNVGLVIAGCTPIIGLVTLLFFWPTQTRGEQGTSVP